MRKKFKKKSPSERSKVKGKVDLESLENLIKGFREETNQSLKGMQRRGEEVWEEVKKVREKWEVWVTKKGAGGESGGEKVKVVDENVSIENERLKSRIREIEKKMKSEEKIKRSRNIVIRGIKVDSETGREEVEKLLGEIGVEVHVGEINGVGRKNGGKPSMYIVEMRNKEEKVNVLKRNKALKGKKERMEDDSTWNERRRKWVMNQRAWGERMKENTAWIGKDRMWINGNMWIWNDEKEELSEERRGALGYEGRKRDVGEKKEGTAGCRVFHSRREGT